MMDPHQPNNGHMQHDQASGMPHNVEAEQQLLGAILLDNSTFYRVNDLITADHFFEPIHAEIFKTCASRIMADHLINPTILKTLMDGHEGLAQLGGPAYLIRIAGASLGSAARSYAMLMVDLWQRRKVLEAMEFAKTMLIGGASLSDAVGAIEIATTALTMVEGKRSSTSFLRATKDAMQKIISAYQGDGLGISVGVEEIDDLVGNLHGGDLVILGGAPSMGKTSLGLSIGNRIADQNIGVVVVSLEMTAEALAMRAIGEKSGIWYSRLKNGKISAQEGPLAAAAANDISNRPIELIEPHIRDIGAIYSTCKRIQKNWENSDHKLGVILVDYLQLVRAPGKDRFQIVGNVSQGLKAMAMQLNVPVIALSQLSRDVQTRDDHRPKLTDLRESGQIEQDADVVIFTHRDHYYLEREGAPRGKDGKVSTEALVDFEAAKSACKNHMEVICGKSRNGGIGDCTIGFEKETNRIWSLHSNIQNAMEFGQ